MLLFNAYATHAMCRAGIDVLDVFPISDAYPGGTGLPRKPFDAVHYKAHVFPVGSGFASKILCEPLTTRSVPLATGHYLSPAGVGGFWANTVKFSRSPL